MSQRQAILTVGLLLATSGSLFGQSVLYVDRSATGPLHDGSTWCQASIELHEALDVAVSGDVIRVADGIYRPSSAGLANPRLATFQLVSGVSIEGGYAGCGAINPDERDIVAYESVLSGDLSGNDGPDFANDGDNSYHVVTYRLHGVTDVVLDGFTVRAGNADGTGPPGTLTNQGPGIHIRDDNYKCIQGGPTIRNCLIRNNRAAHHGAVNNHAWTTVIENCTFRDNVAGEQGAGLLVHSGSAAVTNCLFEGNTVGLVADQGEGGGVWLGHDDDPTCPGQHQSVFTDCVFRGNHSLDRGGGVFGDQKSTPRFDGCTFDNNTADLAGAGAYMKANVTDNDTSTFTSCIFSNNTAMGAGGGLFARRGTITDCTFTENSASTGAGIYALQPGPLVVEASIFVRNATIGEDNNGGGGIYANTAGTIRTSLFRENTTGGNGGGLYNLGFQFTVTDCSFIENNARLGGGVLMYFGEIKNLTNCRFRGNTALTGGGAYVVSGEPTFVNCEFNRNRATEFGGGILFNYNHSRLINCTLYGNTATTGGGVYTQFGTSPATSGSILVDNSILWNNSDEAGTTLSSQIFPDLVTLPVVNYSDVQGWDGSFGGGNNNTNDPLFVDPDGADNIPGTEDDNLRLSAGSSSIDTADNSAVPSGLTTDLDGNPRIENGTVDMGAYERGVCVPLFEFEVVCDDAQDDDCDTLTDCDDSDCANDPACATTGIPTVSQWGVVAMSLLTLTAGTLVFSRKETHTAC